MYTLSNDQSINYEIDLSLIDLKVYTMFKMDQNARIIYS